MAAPSLTRVTAARRGVVLEAASVAWMVAESALAIGAGVAARSVLLTAFGFDSVIEVASATLLLWRLQHEVQGGDTERVELVEVRATKVSAGLLVALCIYVGATSIAGLIAQVNRTRPSSGSLSRSPPSSSCPRSPLANARSIESCRARRSEPTSRRRQSARIWP